MAVRADNVSADERAQLEFAVESQIGGHGEWILLSTCHRVELYGFGTIPALDARLQVESGEDAVSHLIRVAAGLESAIIGEDEVLHQVRDALRQARESRPLDRRLQRLFETAVAAGRRARAGRTASSGSLAQRAVAWLGQKSPLAARPVLIVGAGRMASSLAHAAGLAGAELTIASRDATRAHRLAQGYGGRSINLAEAADLAPQSVAIAVALAGPWHDLEQNLDDLPPIADISAPSAIPAAIRARLNGGFLGIDDLYVRTTPVPGGYIDEAARVVATKTREYVRWLGRD